MFPYTHYNIIVCIYSLCTSLLHTLASSLVVFVYVQSTFPICRQYKGDRSSCGRTRVYYRSVAGDGTGSCLHTLEVDKKRTSTLKKVLADFNHTYLPLSIILGALMSNANNREN